MTLDKVYLEYLAGHQLGRLATVAPNGTPQNKPVGYCYNPKLHTIDIAGMEMERSAKYRNIVAHPDVALVVDDIIGDGPEGVRFLEIRGRAEHALGVGDDHLSPHLIRIHPRRVVSWNVDPSRPGLQTHDLGEAE